MKTLTRKKWISIAKGAGIAAIGALLTNIITVAGDLDWGPWTTLVGAILAIMTNAIRKFGLKDPQPQPVFTQLDLSADEVAGVQIGRQGHKLWVCIDGLCVLRIRSPRIELTDDREIDTTYQSEGYE